MKSSLEFGRQSPSQGPATPECTDVPGSSNMAVSALASSSVRSAGGLPSKIPPAHNTVPETSKGSLPEVTPNIAVWPIFSSVTQQSRFHHQLQASSWHYGGQSHLDCMTQCIRSGLAGVRNEFQSRFLHCE